MPSRILPISATYESVTRLATKSVVDQVMARTGLSPNVTIRFPGETGNDFQPGSAISDKDEAKFEHTNKLIITVQEEYKEDAVINTPVLYHDSPYIFEDTNLEVVLKPVYSYTAVTIGFNMRFATRVEAEAWTNDIKVRMGVNRSTILHELDYHYEVPQLALNILAHLHELREAKAGYGQDLVGWFREKFTKRATTLTTANGASSLMVIGEKAIAVQGWFDFTEPPTPDKDDKGASWHSTFNYRFNYQKPVSIAFYYPLVVHNQQIDGQLFAKSSAYSLSDRPSLKTETLLAYDAHSDLYRKPPDPMGGKRHPVWDDWIPLSIPNFTTSLSSWMIEVSQDDPHELLNMDELGNEVMVKIFRDFLVSEAPYVNRRGHSLIYFTLFKGKVPMPDGSLTMDADLNIRSVEPMDIRQTYHLRLAVITESSILTDRAWKAMQKNGIATLLIWQSLFPTLDVEYALRVMPVDGYLSKKYIDWFFQMMRDQNVGNSLTNDTGKSFNQYPGMGTGGGTVNQYPGGGSGGGGGNGLGGIHGNNGEIYPNKYVQNYYIEWPLVSILTIIAIKQGVE